MRPIPRLRLLAAAAPALLALSGTGPATQRRSGPGARAAVGAGAQPAAAAWTGAVRRHTVRRARVGPRFDPAVLGESSGLAASAAAPGLLWTVNDGGGGAELFAVAADDGRVLGRVAVAGAANVDWEAVAVGPCGASSPAPPAAACVYVGDVGDNAAGGGGGVGRAEVTLYRVPEPLGAPAGPLRLPASTAPPAALAVRYADGPRDVEAMVVLPDGDVWLVTKHPARRPDGGARPALVYRVPAAAWGAPGGATARLVDSLPLTPDATLTGRVTDAAFDPARRLLAVRTYAAVYLIPAAGPPWRVDHARPAAVCDLGVLREPQGEGVTFLPGARGARGAGRADPPRLALSSEANLLGRGGLATAECPPPG
jgi:hypothetical protein